MGLSSRAGGLETKLEAHKFGLAPWTVARLGQPLGFVLLSFLCFCLQAPPRKGWRVPWDGDEQQGLLLAGALFTFCSSGPHVSPCLLMSLDVS